MREWKPLDEEIPARVEHAVRCEDDSHGQECEQIDEEKKWEVSDVGAQRGYAWDLARLCWRAFVKALLPVSLSQLAACYKKMSEKVKKLRRRDRKRAIEQLKKRLLGQPGTRGSPM